MSQMLEFAILALILVIGDFAAIKSKAWLPSIFISAMLILIGYWTFFPKEIVAEAGIVPAVATVFMYLLVINMGTLLSLDELKRQWEDYNYCFVWYLRSYYSFIIHWNSSIWN